MAARLGVLAGHFAAANALNVDISPPPPHLQEQHKLLFTKGAIEFLSNLVLTFQDDIDELLRRRRARHLELTIHKSLPEFSKETAAIRNGDWKVDPLPERLKDVRVTLGDVSPSNLPHLLGGVVSGAMAVQVDFDDGHCPTWCTQLRGLYNTIMLANGRFTHKNEGQTVPLRPASFAVLKLRPRAWNMVEPNVMINGRQVNGALIDFGLLIYHAGAALHAAGAGPWFYLSKMECAAEAQLWDRIFTYSESQLSIPSGAIRATVLIENILAAFETHEILHALRHHSAGLNCGLWDYSASIVATLGERRAFLLPDRSKYVDMERHFLKSYLALVVQTCHARGCIATGGMAAKVLSFYKDPAERQRVVDAVCKAKAREIEWGVDGFLVYDTGLIKPTLDLWQKAAPGARNQLGVTRRGETFTATDLLQMPAGGVTLNGLRLNCNVGLRFILSWLNSQGHFSFNGAVEDSATAEISRSQVWQWIRHQARLEDSNELVTRAFVFDIVDSLSREMIVGATAVQQRRIAQSVRIFKQIVTQDDFPNFITTFLSFDSTFLAETVLDS